MASSTLPTDMKAQHLTAFNKPYELAVVPLPEPTEPNDVLIRVLAASYCHTDAVLAAGQMPGYPGSFPHVGSHEFAGEIVELPAGSGSGLKVGDIVGVPGRSYKPCGACFECADPTGLDPDPPGYSVYCAKAENNGISRAGGFQEYAVVDARQLAPAPRGMRPVDIAVLMCAGVTIYAALKRCGLRPGQRVGIMGCGGGLGHLGLQFASHMGFRVLGVDNADGPLELARRVAGGLKGVDVVDARAKEAAQVVDEVGKEDGKVDKGNMGLDAVIILPESQKAFDYGVALLRTHGRCVVVSFPEKGFHVSARDVVFRDISIIGSLVGSNRTLREMLDFSAEKGVSASVKTYPLSKLNELVEEYHKGGGGKLVVDMSLPDD
jgi:D-arabinose 1-dehydrogenase-like Zn-dependent alcohol dehydrogenase